MSKNVKWLKLDDFVSYRIIDNTIYLIDSNDGITSDYFKIICRKIALLILDNDIAYINITSKNMENNKGVYLDFGFILSYYDVNKINMVYNGILDKKLYRTYCIMTRNDFLDSLNGNTSLDFNNAFNSNDGFISNILLLFTGVLVLCYFCACGAIYLVRQKGRFLL